VFVETFQPIVNFLVLLTALSVAAERLTNLAKLRNPHLRNRTGEGPDAKREYVMAVRTFLAGLLVALVFKADLFEILANLDDPWQTMGWLQLHGSRWVPAPVSTNLGTAIYAVIGSLFTGVALGFGSKFWHDVLGTVYEVRDTARKRKDK
jgi:hypothetical protein